MKQRSPGVLPGVWLGMALAAVPAWAVEVPVVRFVEVGDAGVVFAEVPLRAAVEITTGRPFQGTLVATYRWSEDPAWARGVSWGDRTRIPLDLEPGATALDVELPSAYRAMTWERPQPRLELVWVLEDSGGARLASGRQPARLERGPALRVLHIGAEGSRCRRRAPDTAWSVPARYEPYSVVLVSREDLRGLRADQRQALFDAVALGLTLVVASPTAERAFDPLGPPFDEVLGDERSAWTGNAGDEMRETPLLWGRIRRTTFAPPAPPEGIDDAGLLRWMLVTAPPGGPIPSRVFTPPERRYSENMPDRARGLRRGSALAFAAVTFVLALLFVGSRKYGRPRQFPVAAAVAACLVSPPLLYVALASSPAGNTEWRFRVTVHDGRSPVACVGRYESLGGGGGTEAASLAFEPTRQGIFATGSYQYLQLTIVPSGGDNLLVTASNRGLTPGSILNVSSRALAPPDPLWKADVGWQGDRLAGVLTARRAVRDAWVLGLRGELGARVGAVPAGGRVDLSTLSPERSRAELEQDLGALRRVWMDHSWFLEVPITFWPVPDFSPTAIVSEEPAAPDGTAVYDYLGLHPAGAPDDVLVTLPAIRRGSQIHVAVPRALLLPDDVELLLSRWTDSNPSRPARIEESGDGFRRAVVEGRARALEDWRRLRPDLPEGTGYVAARRKGGT